MRSRLDRPPPAALVLDSAWETATGHATLSDGMVADLKGSLLPQALLVRIVEANVFHRAFALGGSTRAALDPVTCGRLLVNGEERAAAPVGDGHEERVRAVADMLAAVGERLLPGDVLITGSVVQVPVRPGDEVVADLGELGSVRLHVGS